MSVHFEARRYGDDDDGDDDGDENDSEEARGDQSKPKTIAGSGILPDSEDLDHLFTVIGGPLGDATDDEDRNPLRASISDPPDLPSGTIKPLGNANTIPEPDTENREVVAEQQIPRYLWGGFSSRLDAFYYQRRSLGHSVRSPDRNPGFSNN